MRDRTAEQSVPAITNELGRLEEFFSEAVYPVWPLWTAVVIALALGAAYIAYRRSWHRVAVRHPLITLAAASLIVAVTIPTVYYLASPLFERSLACEASPLAGAGAGSEKCEDTIVISESQTPSATAAANSPGPSVNPAATPQPTFAARLALRGEFHGADDFHFGRGKALLIETAPGQYVLRFEEFSVRNGPDLHVYLTTEPESYGTDPVYLGALKATDGAFNYDVPPGADISRFKGALVWCRQFSVLFAIAPLVPA